MAKDLFHICLNEEPLVEPPAETSSEWGARITFAGVVRGDEADKSISGINYTAYVAMAGKVLRQIGEEGRRRFPEHGLWLEHRIGFVPAGEVSLYLMVLTPHSREGYEISRWYLDQVKTVAPIWKGIRLSSSERQEKGAKVKSKR